MKGVNEEEREKEREKQSTSSWNELCLGFWTHFDRKNAPKRRNICTGIHVIRVNDLKHIEDGDFSETSGLRVVMDIIDSREDVMNKRQDTTISHDHKQQQQQQQQQHQPKDLFQLKRLYHESGIEDLFSEESLDLARERLQHIVNRDIEVINRMGQKLASFEVLRNLGTYTGKMMTVASNSVSQWWSGSGNGGDGSSSSSQ